MVKKAKAKKIIAKKIKPKSETPVMVGDDVIKTKNMDGIQIEDAQVK